MIERIDSAVFGPVPDFVRLTIRLHLGAAETPSTAAAARALLVAAAAAVDGPAPFAAAMAAWRAAYADVGLPASTVPPPEALLAWARAPGGVPSQGAVPDVLNALSLRLGVPTAGYAVDGIQGDLWLRPSRGCETHLPLGGDTARPPTVPINELILADSADFAVARAWHGAPGAQAFVGPACRDVVVHVDLLPPAAAAGVDPAATAAEVTGVFGRLFGGRASWQAVSRAAPAARWPA